MISGYTGRSPRSWIWRVVSNPIKRCEVLDGNLLDDYSPASTPASALHPACVIPCKAPSFLKQDCKDIAKLVSLCLWVPVHICSDPLVIAFVHAHFELPWSCQRKVRPGKGRYSRRVRTKATILAKLQRSSSKPLNNESSVTQPCRTTLNESVLSCVYVLLVYNSDITSAERDNFLCDRFSCV